MNSVINSLEKVKLSSRNLTATQSVASSLLYLTHTTAQAIKEKKTRYEVSELSIFSENHFLDQSEKELWYRNKVSGSVGQTRSLMNSHLSLIFIGKYKLDTYPQTRTL